MGSDPRKQLNMRADEETVGRLARLVKVVSTALRVDLSQSDILRLALIELEAKYSPPKKTK